MKKNKIWNEGQVRNITFIVTDECQLRCHYCYIVKKNTFGKMDFEIAKRSIDYLLNESDSFSKDGVVWDFIGGEPLLEIELIDKICDYFKINAYEMKHKWFDNYRISFATNGLLYRNKKVQQFISKNISHLSISVSIDGIKEKHDTQRVYPNGKGSYDDVVKIIPYWIEQFGKVSTKATVSSDDLPYLKESVVHLFDLGISDVNINTVFENVWKDGDDQIFEYQLIELGNYILKNKLYKNNDCSLFSELIGKPLDPILEKENWCGAGKMLAIYPDGCFYPCVRFAPYSMVSSRARKIGDCYTGLNHNRLRPFWALDRITQSSEECINCSVASGCAWCQGFNLDAADTDTIYQRATFICRMHKARVRANKFYWDKLKQQEPDYERYV